MSFADRIADALAGTQAIAIVGDPARDEVLRTAACLGYEIITTKAIAQLGGDELSGLKAPDQSLLLIEDAHLITDDLEDELLDLMFDGSRTLPSGTLIAVHFSAACALSEALSDEDVPITYLEMDSMEERALIGAANPLAVLTHKITRLKPADLRSIPLAA